VQKYLEWKNIKRYTVLADALLPHFSTPSFLNAVNLEDNLVINSIYELLSSYIIQNIYARLLVILKLATVELDKVTKSGNTAGLR